MLNKNIRHLRQLSQLSQGAFGESFGASRSMIDSYERNNAKPSNEMLKAIAARYHITIDALLSRDLSKNSTLSGLMSTESLSDIDIHNQAKNEIITELRRQVKNQQDIINNQQRIIECFVNKGLKT